MVMRMKFKADVDVMRREMLSDELLEYITKTPMTHDERESVYDWVSKGNSVYSNPCWITGEDGKELDFLSAIRTVAALAEESAPDELCIVNPCQNAR